MAEGPILIAVPNVSEGRDHSALEQIETAFAPARFLDLHADPDHNRSVFTLAAPQGELARGLANGARAVVERVDLSSHEGLHPWVGALDVMPVVYLSDEQRGAACAELLTAAGLIGDELEVPVILYGELATRPENRERAALREGGRERIAERLESGELVPDFGPPRPHPTAGVTLAAARPPLIAFNVEVEGTLEDARAIAARIREGGSDGLPGVRAIGVQLGRAAQVSTNIEDHAAASPAQVVAAVARHAPVAAAELVGLAPVAALADFPEGVPLRNRAVIEERLNYPR